VLNDIFYLESKFLVSLKFVGAFCPPFPSFIVQKVFVGREEEVFCYKHFPLPRFLTGKSLGKWEEKIERDFPSFTPFTEKLSFLSVWIEEVETAEWIGIGNYLGIEEAKKKTSLLVVYEWEGKRLILGKESFKPIPDKRAVDYLLPCGAFPETIKKLGVEYGT